MAAKPKPTSKAPALAFADVKHYQCILKILAKTQRITKTIKMDLHP